MTADVRLLPCPFCGSPALVRRKGRRIWWFPSEGKVSCSNHSCGAYYSYWHPREWNARTTASLNATIEMLRKRVEELNAQLRAAFSAKGAQAEAEALREIQNDAARPTPTPRRDPPR